MSELPTVEIEGRPYVAVMMAADEGPSEVLDKARMNMKELAEMVAKLPRDERSELMGTALASIAMACESRVAEIEQELATSDGRRREARQLLAKAFRMSRRPAQIETLLNFMVKVGDYLKRTSDPNDILREAAERGNDDRR